MKPYTEIPGFDSVVLEESFVLGICANPGILVLRVDLALTPDHPAYATPPPSSTECFRRGLITFYSVQRLFWEGQGAPPATDATGEVDYGHFDTFEWNDGEGLLEGDWGRISVMAARIGIELTG